MVQKVLYFLVLLVGIQGTAYAWLLKGIELMGTSIAKDKITQNVPFRIGNDYNPFTFDRTILKQVAQSLQKKYNFASVKCDLVGYDNGDVFLVIDIVEQSKEKSHYSTQVPTTTIAWHNEQLPLLHEKLYQRMFQIFNEHQSVQETWDKGYLDFSDPLMHGIVQQLIEIVPQYREHLIDIVLHASDTKKRSIAANLLNWSQGNFEDTVSKIMILLHDMELEVRNNIARFIIYIVKELRSLPLRQALIDALLLQLAYPSHADRNKAIVNLLFLAQEFKEDRTFIKKGYTLIHTLATTSVLPNVKDPACKLLTLLEKSRTF